MKGYRHLTPAEERAIANMRRGGMTRREIRRVYGCGESTLTRIFRKHGVLGDAPQREVPRDYELDDYDEYADYIKFLLRV